MSNIKSKRVLKVLALCEIAAVLLAILFDLLIPAVVILLLAGLSLLLRKEKPSSLGFHKFDWRLPLYVLAWAILWTLADVGLFMPLLNRLTGTVQDVSTFTSLQGNIAQLVFFVIMSWTLAAFVEETAFRGFLITRVAGLLKSETAGYVVAAIVSSALFGLIHTEQGIVGVVVSMLDAAFYCFLKWKYKNLWAAIFAHGFINTIGMVAFFFAGPISGLW